MRVEIRQVSGWGARCGCGGQSILHRTTGRPVTPESSTFLCHDCVEVALAAFRLSRPDQPPYWPGDEGRDEPYVAPNPEAAA